MCMSDLTLLDVVAQRFGANIDADSDAGQILGSLKRTVDLGAEGPGGNAEVAPLSFTPPTSGVSIRASTNSDAVVFSIPAVETPSR